MANIAFRTSSCSRAGSTGGSRLVTHFGCRKPTESTLLRTTTGTSAYFAPELHPFLLDCEGETSVAVDIWAVGAIAFRVVIGRLPFKLQLGPDLKRYFSGGPLPFPDQHSLSPECMNWIAAAMKPYADQHPTAEEALASSWIGESSTAYGFESSIATPAPPDLAGSIIRPSSVPIEEYSPSDLCFNQWDTVSTAPTMRLPQAMNSSFTAGSDSSLTSTSTIRPAQVTRNPSDPGRPDTPSRTPQPGIPVNVQGPKRSTPWSVK